MPLPIPPTFLLAVALVELTPGPNMGWLAVVSATHGRGAAGRTLAPDEEAELNRRLNDLAQSLRWKGEQRDWGHRRIH